MYLEAALGYVRRGWRVFPLSPGQKVPRAGSKGVLDASADEGQVVSWWERDPEANIGIACGMGSNLFVVDVDPRHGGDRTIAELQERNGRLPSTVLVRTGGGGIQVYFSCLPGLRSGAGRLGEGVDHRGEGGYVVAPPSLHPSGDRYEFYEGFAPEDIELVAPPDWIVAGLRKEEQGQHIPLKPDYFRDLFKRGAKEGERNDALVKMAGHLLRKKLDPLLVLYILRLWNDHCFDPPGDPEKLEGIVDRVAGRELERISKRERR